MYEEVVSKSGFAAKVITPVEASITNSSPEMLYSWVASASGSVASAVPIADWFSGAVNEASEVNEGEQFIRFFSEIMYSPGVTSELNVIEYVFDPSL